MSGEFAGTCGAVPVEGAQHCEQSAAWRRGHRGPAIPQEAVPSPVPVRRLPECEWGIGREKDIALSAAILNQHQAMKMAVARTMHLGTWRWEKCTVFFHYIFATPLLTVCQTISNIFSGNLLGCLSRMIKCRVIFFIRKISLQEIKTSLPILRNTTRIVFP